MVNFINWPTIVTSLVLSLLSGAVVHLRAKVEKKAAESDAIAEGMKYLLKFHINEQLSKHEDNGSITALEYGELEGAVAAYKNLGGNGATESRWNKVKETVKG